MRPLIPALLSLTLSLCLATASAAQDRIALVIGNGNYSSVAGLENPPNDARLIAGALTDSGFEVTLLLDADKATMIRGIGQFGRDLRNREDETVALFFYAGHGVQSFGQNFLLPVDVSLTDAADLPLVGVDAQAILRQMFSARNSANIVILDACRNNPFETVRDMDDNGLAEMKAPAGTFLSYSTAPGEVAVDGLGGNSPFTEALAEHIPQPGVPIEQTFKSVRVDVLQATNGRQVPWETSSLTAAFEFTPSQTTPFVADGESLLWEMVRDSGNPAQIELFLQAHPGSEYDTEARALLDQLTAPPAAPAPVVAARVVAVPQASEQEMIERAQHSGTRAEYQAYLDAYPGGTYAELAAFEIAILDQQTAPPAPAPAPVAPAAPAIIGFTTPLAQGGPDIEGKTLEQLIAGSPLFPPIEGLPDAVWKGKTCTNCHAWERANLCTQGQTYALANGERSLSKKHPYGGGFKANVARWANTGCQ